MKSNRSSYKKFIIFSILAASFVLALVAFNYYQKVDQKINVVWLVDRKGLWEEDWLMELLSGMDIEVTEDLNQEKFLNNSIFIVGLNTNNHKYDPYFKKLHDLNYNFGIIHLSDEIYAAPTDFYKYAKFVFRNYWHEKFKDNENIIAFPLGYKKGFWADNVQVDLASKREYNWSFAGRTFNTPTREAMIAQLKSVPNYHLFITSDFGDTKALSVLEYRNILLKSNFTPCGAGWRNLDSFRVYEALECGSIPIVETKPSDYFANFYGKHPFVTVETWDQAPSIINVLLADPVLLEKRRRECYNWWIDYKKVLKQKMAEEVKTKLAV